MFVIKGRPKHFQGSFRARSAEFLLTTAAGLGAGDEILARLPVSICGPDEEEPDTIRATVYPGYRDRRSPAQSQRRRSADLDPGPATGLCDLARRAIGGDRPRTIWNPPSATRSCPPWSWKKSSLGAEYEFVPVQFEAPGNPAMGGGRGHDPPRIPLASRVRDGSRPHHAGRFRGRIDHARGVGRVQALRQPLACPGRPAGTPGLGIGPGPSNERGKHASDREPRPADRGHELLGPSRGEAREGPRVAQRGGLPGVAAAGRRTVVGGP